MDINDKEKIFRFKDSSPEAISRRLRAARSTVTGQQKEFAALANVKVTTYNSQEVKGAPSIEVLEYLYRNHRIGPNFILFGEFLPLPGDVQLALLDALRDLD
jgi:hypothetical protein